jgi:proteasome accessory factor B
MGTWSGSVARVSVQPSVAAKTERLLNLVIALLSTRMPLTKARIRAAVPQYQDTASVEAFDRMFERDKDELRELGIPLETSVVDPLFDDELGYRIDRREYALPEISFTPDEVSALVLAGRIWSQASLAAQANAALTKLAATGVVLDDRSVVGVEPRIRTQEASFEPLRRAVRDRRAVTFDYRKADGTLAARRVQPWGLTQWRGRWYVTGWDAQREAERVFRLGRIVGPVKAVGSVGAYAVPADHEPRVLVRSTEPEVVDQPPAILRVRVGAGNTLRRRARSIGDIDDQWSLVDIDYRDIDGFAAEVAGFGPDVVVEAPQDLQRAVLSLLREAAARHTGAVPGEQVRR